MSTPGRADWGTFRDRGDGFCSRCGRTIGWHSGLGCYSPTSTGMPEPSWKHSTACGIFEDEPAVCTCKADLSPSKERESSDVSVVRS